MCIILMACIWWSLAVSRTYRFSQQCSEFGSFHCSCGVVTFSLWTLALCEPLHLILGMLSYLAFTVDYLRRHLWFNFTTSPLNTTHVPVLASTLPGSCCSYHFKAQNRVLLLINPGTSPNVASCSAAPPAALSCCQGLPGHSPGETCSYTRDTGCDLGNFNFLISVMGGKQWLSTVGCFHLQGIQN